ncbi:hypothetical protein V1525DRAFT_455647 [Lipomyces kononenkoae]|uniref:Uncharacterized protein n=1 Tax=Lipomyces kononenkoae TaxID=34357 RepID=A0ACC3T577_LIPKO
MPWLDIHPDYTAWNVESAVNDTKSVFRYWKNVLALRKKEKDVFIYRSPEMGDPEHEKVIANVRTEENRSKAFIFTNFIGKEIWWAIPKVHEIFLIDGKLKMEGSNTQFKYMTTR